jgi:hypothetical protein
MKRLSTLLLGFGLFIGGCHQPAAQVTEQAAVLPTTPVSTTMPVTADGEFVIGEGVTHANLTVFPILSKAERDKDRLLTLDEGLASGKVEVRELGAAGNEPQSTNAENPPDANDPFGSPITDEQIQAEIRQAYRGNSVNRVVVVNKSDRPLYLMPGEIILGGSQDRTIGRELVIAPTGEPVEIDVFCVEHGRWGGKGIDTTVAQLSALRESASAQSWEEVGGPGSVEEFPQNLSLRVDLTQAAKEADEGKFVASAGALSKSGRVAAQHEKSQSKVWEEVAEANAKGNITIRSGAFTGQYVETEAMKRLDPYLEHLTKEISEQPNVVGVVVTIDGRVESFDVFESTPLFRKLWPKLLKSFAVDAANAAEGRGPEEKAPAACTQQVAATFVKDAIAAEATSQEESNGLAIATSDTEKVLLFSAHDPSHRPFVTSVVPEVEGAPSHGGVFGGGGAFGGSVHGFGASK